MPIKRWLIILTVFLVACSTTGTKGPSDPSMERRVEGNKIFIGEKLYAELLLICKDDISDRYKGIAIHYVDGGRYEWISPEKGWTVISGDKRINDIKQLKDNWVWDRRQYYSTISVLKGTKRVDHKEFILVDWRWDVNISEDGLAITYVEGKLFGPKDREYQIK